MSAASKIGQYCYNITDPGLDNLLRLWGGTLTELDLSYTNISGKEISALCLQLQKLCLRWCQNLTDHGLDNMLRMWGGALKDLDLYGTKISDKGIQAIQARYPHLLVVKGWR